MKRLQTLFLNNGIYEIIRDDKKLNNFLATLSINDAEKYLTLLNSKVRNIPESEAGIYQGTMLAGSLISPNKQVQRNCLEKSLKAVNSIKDRKDKACLMYCLINDLHLFKDGNGRTSRLVYEMLSNKDFDLNQSDNFTHDESDFAKIMSYKFEKQKGIGDIDLANNCASFFLFEKLIKAGTIVNDERIINKSISTYGRGMVQDHSGVYIPEDIKTTLSENEITLINTALTDNNEIYSVSGLTMLIMATKKGLIDKYLTLNDSSIADLKEKYPNMIKEIKQREKRVVFRVAENDESGDTKKIFEGWNKEDYLKATEYADFVKESLLDILIDFFINPKDYNFTENLTVLDKITCKEMKKEEISI